MTATVRFPRLILASGSIYRRELLARLQIPFDVVVPAIDEQPFAGELPIDTALRLAQKKAAAVSAMHANAIVIGSDQVATLDGNPIGKPGTHEAALKQLQSMRGRSVAFHTALCLIDGRVDRSRECPDIQCSNSPTRVTFRHLPDDELEAYLLREQPYDCAGSAKIEGLGISLIEKVESIDPTALIGLPLIALTGMLREIGVSVLAGRPG